MDGLSAAIAFLTRFPCPCSQRGLERSTLWFCVVGLLIGVPPSLLLMKFEGVLAAFWAASLLWLTSGGLHLDGLADSCDAFFSGKKGEAFCTVLKDSRLGTFGALSLLLILGGNFTALWQLSDRTTWAWIAPLWAATAARALPPLLLAAYPYKGQLAIDHAKGARWPRALINLWPLAGLLLLACRDGLPPFDLLLAAGLGTLLPWAAVKHLITQADGLKGDFLGLAVESSTCTTLTALAVLWTC